MKTALDTLAPSLALLPPNKRRQERRHSIAPIADALEAVARLRVGLGLAASLSMRVLAAVLLAGAAEVAAQTIDYDDNDNGYIDVRSVVQLNAIRWDLNGNGAADNAGDATSYANAFPTPATGMGCPGTGCMGYELRRNLDFDTDGDGDVDSMDPDSYTNFGPIGGTFTATFRGNGHSISNLTMTNSSNRVGLFGVLGSSATVRGVGLIRPTVSRPGAAGVTDVGALAGRNDGTIVGCYVMGGTVSSAAANATVGGLVGRNQALVRTSYATASVSAPSASAGGLAGVSTADRASPPFTNVNGKISNSYAAASVSGTNQGGLTSNAWPSGRDAVLNSYWDNTITSAAGSQVSGNLGKATSELQTPSAYDGIYSAWDDTDGDAWDFGASTEYPALKFDGLDPRDQRPGLRLSATALAVRRGGSASYRVRLNTRPSAAVTVTVGGATAAVTVEPTMLTFTTTNWRTERTVTVRAADSAPAYERLDLIHSAAGGGYSGLPAVRLPSVSVTVGTPPPPPPNEAPVAVGEFDGLDLDPGRRVEVNLLGKFRDPEGGALAHSAESLNPEVASAVVSEGRLWVEGRSAGLATVLVKATDSGGQSAQLAFRVTVGRVLTFAAAAAAPEGGVARLGVELTRPLQRAVAVGYVLEADSDPATADADAEDHGGSDGTVTLAAGETEAFIEVPILDDDDIEPAREHLRVRLLAPAAEADWVLGLATASVVIQEGVCDRTPAVRDALRGARECWAPSVAELAGTGYLNLGRQGIASLRAGDFLGLPGLRVLHLHGNRLAELPDGLFAGLGSLERLRLEGNRLSELPEGLLAGLGRLSSLDLGGNRISSLPADLLADAPSLSRLHLGGNRLSELPAGFFEGASNLAELNLSGNPGAPFTLTMELVRTDAEDHAPGPATVAARVAEGAPFALSAGLAAESAELSADMAAIGAGEVSGAPIQVALTEGGAARLSLSGTPEAPSALCGEVDEGRYPCFQGLAVEAGPGLLLFKRPPWVVQAVPEQGVESLGGALLLDLAGLFSSDRDDALSYAAASSDPALASVEVSGGVLSIEPNGEGLEGLVTVRVTATDTDGLVVEQSFLVEVSPQSRRFGRGWRLGWLLGTPSPSAEAAPAGGEPE